MNRPTLQRLVRAYVNAEINNSWKGGGDPDDYVEIEEELARSKAKLWTALDKLLDQEDL